MCVNNLPKVAIQWNSGATRDSNRGRRVLIPSALTTRPPSHTTQVNYVCHRQLHWLDTACWPLDHARKVVLFNAYCMRAQQSCASRKLDVMTKCLLWRLTVHCCTLYCNCRMSWLLCDASCCRSDGGSILLPKAAQDLLLNMSVGNGDISIPTVYHYLPHLIGKPSSLTPAIKLSKGRAGGECFNVFVPCQSW